MKKITSLLLAVIVTLSTAALFSCGNKPSKDEVIRAAKKLIEASREVNEIYFGEGLPFEEEGERVELIIQILEGDDDLEVDVKSLEYLPVAEDCEYKTVAELKALAAAVYSTDYCTFLYSRTFETLHDSDDSAVMFARYLEQYGMLTVRRDRGGQILPLDREYDLETVNVVRVSRDYALIEVDTYVNGEKIGTSDFKLVRELIDSIMTWRLDTPTY